jgi:hypothetical protein
MTKRRTDNIEPKAERRKWLADRPRRIAAEEEMKGLFELAAEFRQRALDVEKM